MELGRRGSIREVSSFFDFADRLESSDWGAISGDQRCPAPLLDTKLEILLVNLDVLLVQVLEV